MITYYKLLQIARNQTSVSRIQQEGEQAHQRVAFILSSSASDNTRLLWRTVSCLLHPAPREAWFWGLDTTALATGFLDKIWQVKLKIDAGLFGMTENSSPSVKPNFVAVLSFPSTSMSSFNLVTQGEVERHMSSTNEDISNRHLTNIGHKSMCPRAISHYCYLVNQSFTTGQFPSKWKSGLVTPYWKARSWHVWLQ